MKEEEKIPKENKPQKDNNKKLLVIFVAIMCVIAVGISGYGIAKQFLGKEEDKEEKEEKKDKQKEQITPLMYKVTKEGSDNIMYLFGSMHTVNFDDFDLPKYVMDAYKESDYLAVEVDINKYMEDEEKIQQLAMDMMYMDGTTIKDHIDEELYTKIINFLKEKKLYNQAYESFKLYGIESLITSQVTKDAGLNENDGIDTYLLDLAKKENKEILEVETFDFQMKLLFEAPDKYYEISILSSIDEYEKSVNSLKELYSAWKKGDVEALEKLTKGDEVTEEDIEKYKLTQEEMKEIETFSNAMLKDRNVGMKNKFNEYFNGNKKVFYMVGAAHLIGDDGLASLLEKEGYKVTRVN